MKDELVYIAIAFIVCVFFAWLYSRIAKDKERILLIEKGINPDEYLKSEMEKSGDILGNLWSKIGIVVIGIGVGLTLMGSFKSLGLSEIYLMAVMWFSVGASLLIVNRLGKKN